MNDFENPYAHFDDPNYKKGGSNGIGEQVDDPNKKNRGALDAQLDGGEKMSGEVRGGNIGVYDSAKGEASDKVRDIDHANSLIEGPWPPLGNIDTSSQTAKVTIGGSEGGAGSEAHHV